jgi:hypothetical protein
MALPSHIAADFARPVASRPNTSAKAEVHSNLALGRKDDEALLGGFPFRLLALSYGLGLMLSIGMVAAGFGALAAALAGWAAGVAVTTALPFASAALDRFLGDVKYAARREARRRATLEAWGCDLEAERVEARAYIHGR